MENFEFVLNDDKTSIGVKVVDGTLTYTAEEVAEILATAVNEASGHVSKFKEAVGIVSAGLLQTQLSIQSTFDLLATKGLTIAVTDANTEESTAE